MLEERELNKEHFQKYYDISMDDTPEDPEEESKSIKKDLCKIQKYRD